MPTRIKRYEDRADSLDSLLERIEAEMGPDALLEIRNFKRGAFLGLFGGTKMVEVIATLKLESAQAGGPPVAPEPIVPAPPRVAMPEAKPPAVEPEPAPVEAAPPADKPAEPVAIPVSEPVKVDSTPIDPKELEDMRDSISQLKNAVIEMAGIQQKALEANRVYEPSPEELEKQNEDATKLALISTSIVDLQSTVTRLAQAKAEPPPQPEETPELKEISSSIGELQTTLTKMAEDKPEPVVQTLDAPELKEIRESIATLQSVVGEMAEVQRDTVDSMLEADPTKELKQSMEQDRRRLLEMNQSIDGLKSTVRDFITDQRETAAEQAKSRPVLEPASILPIIHRETYGRLLTWGISPDDATGLIYQALDEQGMQLLSEKDLLASIKSIVCNQARIAAKPDAKDVALGRVISLVGATGVGKTTTISKLAAYLTFQLGKQVSLVSLDNYRIAAADQLRKYCDIMGLELDIAFTPEDYVAALEKRANSDLILVDTAGRSPRNSVQVEELQEFFTARKPDEVHLVISAATNSDDLKTILASFEPLAFDQVIVSKLDETHSAGCIHNLSKSCPAPLSYFTIGQNVPEDIREASTDFIREWFELEPTTTDQ